jgi:ABC-2 type transport system ATP-binding protein
MQELRRQHRIHGRLCGPMPAVPANFNGELRVTQPAADEVQIDTAGELAPLLGWLATMPLSEVHIEPVRLQVVYDRFHGGANA